MPDEKLRDEEKPNPQTAPPLDPDLIYDELRGGQNPKEALQKLADIQEREADS